MMPAFPGAPNIFPWMTIKEISKPSSNIQQHKPTTPESSL